MKRRIPLWMTLLPLVAGLGLWGLMWTSQANDLRADLKAILPQAGDVPVGGFPYRLQAHVAPVAVNHMDSALTARIDAPDMTVNRVPWQRSRQVLNLSRPEAEIALRPLRGARLLIRSETAQASLRLDDARIARLSGVWEKARIETGLLPVSATADRFEAHLRETPSLDSAAEPRNPRLPTQAQIVLGAQALRLGDGDALGLAMDMELTAASRIQSLAGWLDRGTVEIERMSLKDATGEVALMRATIVPDGAGGLRVAGTIETVCPANVRATLAGQPPLSEKRARRAEVIAFSGLLPGEVTAEPRDPSKPPPPVRGQEPPCPRLR
ncbi:hypothetical protein ACUJ46_09630 [Sandaracinobacteroides sp. A072]|uniref:hypothetical protein n=1 Tax=Sandaracinobacteroides sp. A072 TaxID=3461146 RepID=UPI0040429579